MEGTGSGHNGHKDSGTCCCTTHSPVTAGTVSYTHLDVYKRQIMNRLLVEGNFYGGLVQGIGLALTEDFEDLNHDTSLKNCGIPYPNDAPDDIELHFNETYRPSGPYGAAGCGEAPLDAPHPAILNAIYNATGARITRVPARPEKVLAALKELEK